MSCAVNKTLSETGVRPIDSHVSDHILLILLIHRFHHPSLIPYTFNLKPKILLTIGNVGLRIPPSPLLSSRNMTPTGYSALISFS